MRHIEEKLSVPVIGKCDVLVAGGGIAGIAAGRCISVTDAMWDITRVIPTCAVTGEAAGIAAAMFDVLDNVYIATLQAEIRRCGGRLHTDKVFDE